MVGVLKIYLKGIFIKSDPVFIPDHKDELSFEDNCKIREIALHAAIETMKIENARAIVKCEYDYTIVPVFKSLKFENYEPDEPAT